MYVYVFSKKNIKYHHNTGHAMYTADLNAVKNMQFKFSWTWSLVTQRNKLYQALGSHTIHCS